MGRPASVRTTVADLGDAIESAANLFRAIQSRTSFTGRTIRDEIHPKNARRIIGLAFVAIAAAWEDFVEDVFMRYLLGAPFPGGGEPQRRIGRCESLHHAYQVFTGQEDFNPANKYLSFRNWETVVKKAEIYFENGHPFAEVKDWQRARIADAFVIRDRVVHRSEKASESFKRVAREHLGRQAKANLGRGFDVGTLLLAAPAVGFPGPQPQTYFEAYAQLFRELARTLAP